MRPTERFFEANFYSQVARAWHPSSLCWFTPSTNAEVDYGFDTFINLGGRFFFFQFKHPKARRTRKKLCLDVDHDYVQTHADHTQMQTLRDAAANWPPGSFFYAMPDLVDWADYSAADVTNLLDHTYYFDLLWIQPQITAPTKSDGTPRLSGEHQLNLDPHCPRFKIRSEPIDADASRFSVLVDQYFVPEGQNAPQRVTESRESFREFVKSLPRSTMCLLVSPA